MAAFFQRLIRFAECRINTDRSGAGGPVDIVARIMSQWLSEKFGQQFIVENRAGSGGNIAAAAINSAPDG